MYSMNLSDDLDALSFTFPKKIYNIKTIRKYANDLLAIVSSQK